MSKKIRSARGDVVDFDLLAIKQQLSVTPAPVNVEARRRFIDEKDGIKVKAPVASALSIALEAAEESASAAEKDEEVVEVVEEKTSKTSKK